MVVTILSVSGNWQLVQFQRVISRSLCQVLHELSGCRFSMRTLGSKYIALELNNSMKEGERRIAQDGSMDFIPAEQTQSYTTMKGELFRVTV